jgi:hypothetical protein
VQAAVYKEECDKRRSVLVLAGWNVIVTLLWVYPLPIFLYGTYINTMPSNEPIQTPPRPLVWGSLFTNNAWVYYQPHSLSVGSGGSGVRNCRHKARKT